MDTIIAKIPDTLAFKNVGGQALVTYSPIILSALSFFLSLLAFWFSFFWNRRQSWKKEITLSWIALTEDRIKLWRSLEDAYKKWDNPIKGKHAKLGSLLKAASFPEDLKKASTSLEKLKELIKNLQNGKDENNQALLNFCERALSKPHLLNEKEAPLDIYGIGIVIAKLSWSLDGWVKIFKFRKYLKMKFGSDQALFKIMTYWELALISRIEERWSDRSGLFALAYDIVQKGNKTK